MDRLMTINNIVYDFQIELNYWETYYSNLIDFLLYSSDLKKSKIKKIHTELVFILSHINKMEKKIERKLKKTHYYDSEKYFNLIQKQNDTK
tara:strand:+ start:807 stop:1079 length:273 start_codon:yes stop_codon:yes gene_type:complete